MENILHVIKERDNAYLELETGRPHPATEQRVQLDVLGRWVKKYRKEHFAPIETMPDVHPEARGDWKNKYITLLKEKEGEETEKKEEKKRKRLRKIKKIFGEVQ